MAVSEEKYQSALRRLRNLRASGEAALMTVVESVETVGGAAGFSFADGYFGKMHAHSDGSSSTGVYVFGVPYQMLVGTVIHGLGAIGMISEHMHAIGNGAFSSGAARTAYESGVKARAHHDAQAPKAASSGSRIPLTMSAGRRAYSDLELERIARGAA